MAALPYISFLALAAIFLFGAVGWGATLVALLFLAVAIMASVYHAEAIAHRIGEGPGTIVLALSVTVIEVGLIVSLMSAGGEGASAVARDTVFSAVMIVCNGIVGICLLLGGWKYQEVGFQFRGAASLLVVLLCLSIFCFVLPNFTTSVPGPYYTTSQLVFVSAVSLLLYCALVLAQTKTHRDYFRVEEEGPIPPTEESAAPTSLWVSLLALITGLASVIGLAKFLAPAIESGVSAIGAPRAVVGLVIATIVLLPEAITAVLAARQNRLQNSLNLALGSGAASIALTVPVVSVYSVMMGQPLLLGLDAKSTVLLLLTFLVGSLTLGNGKATALQGLVHLIILCAFFAVTLVP